MLSTTEKPYAIRSAEDLAVGTVRERISPLKTPALAVQTYEYFSADPKARERAVNAFLAGETDTIPLEYTKLFDAEGQRVDFVKELKMLEDLMRDLRDPEYPEFIGADELSRTAEMTFYTAAYRYSELEFIKVVQELNRPGITEEEMLWAADKYRSLNEKLYGAPTPETYQAIRGEIWSEIDNKDFHPSAQLLIDELRNGFVGETGTLVAPLEYSTDSLPTLSENAEIWIKERLLESHGEYYELAQKHWQKIVDRDTADGKDPQFTGEDLYVLFCEALDILDPEHKSGITIERNPKSGLLSWNTPTLSVRAGTAERKTPVDSPEKAFAKLLHELVAFHGGRTKSGLETDAPILGMGVYSEFNPEDGESPDYLTVEEGAASLAEAILAGEIVHDGHSQWEPERLRLYMNTAMATLEQRSSREIYEITWRYTVLMRIHDNEELSEAMIKRAQKEAAVSLERYERGIPANLPKEAGRIGFHKDIAYLNGRMKAIKLYEYFAENNDVESFSNFQKTKTDPTNHRQNSFAADHGYPVRVPVTLAA